MPRATVKLYGLVRVTERAFLVIQGAYLAICWSAFALAVWVPPDGERFRAAAEIGAAWPDQTSPDRRPQVTPFAAWVMRSFGLLLDYAPWILIALIAVGLLETMSVLRKFRALQAGQLTPAGTERTEAAGGNAN